MQSIKVVICEDHNLTIDGLRVLISAHPKFIVSGCANTAQELFNLLNETQPAILILDINLGKEDGFTILQKLRPQFPQIKVLLLTMHDDDFMVEKAKQLKANGFLLKSVGGSELMEALEGIMTNSFYENPQAKARRMNGQQQRDEFVIRMKLTKREVEIIQRVVQGESAETISEKLFLSLHTVRTHKKNIMKKVGVTTTADLVRYAMKNNMA